ncbi:hypothetical protein EYE40_00410 [Glaciihabitans arcticus]|uniref:Large extracellular alpha-helical protein n=1 Tax=Glaciihabitans arcticus TaxID=2668039 RepID=A0A4Q9GMT0_9MICO|nr:DUF5719 family protein [Glaciihabitans arcticus]TBN55981.1 hypothetical protein EYE40_00410 [Glaciihabitans arcticus]
MSEIEPVQETVVEPAVETTSPPSARAGRGAALVGARIVSGTVGLAVAAVAILGATFISLPGIQSTAPSVDVIPVPTAQLRVCAGGVLRLGDESGQDATNATAIGRPVVEFRSTGDVDTADLAQSDSPESSSRAAPTVLSAAPGEADPNAAVLLAGSQSQLVNSGDFVGFATAECTGAATDSWLVGGSAEVGRTTLITLANPTEVVSEVTLEIFGADGAIAAPGASGIVVQPQSQRVLSLASFAPGLASPVIHVTATGGAVVANLQQSVVRGLTTGGVDIVGATAAPAKSQVIPGLTVLGSEDLESSLAQDGNEDLATSLRVYVPGDDAIDEGSVGATVNIVSSDGVGTGASFTADVEIGRVTEVPVEGLLDGTYTVTVSSSVPIVAGLRASTVAPAQGLLPATSDFAWLGATTRLGGDTLLTVADGPQPVLHLSNPGASTITVDVAELDGTSSTVTVSARSSATTPVNPGSAYRLSGFSALYAAVSFAAPGQLGGYGVQPPALSSSAVTIFP